MPFPVASPSHRLIERVRRVRETPVMAYGAAVAATAGAIALRMLVDSELMAGLPFITFYPAIITATLIGGIWPGVLSLVLSVLAAWYLFLPPVYSWHLDLQAVFSLMFFAAIALINIALVRLLDRAMDQVIAREDNIRVLVEAVPAGIVVVDAEGRISLVNASMEKLFGYTRFELIGQSVEVLVPDGRAEGHKVVRSDFQQRPETRPMGSGRDLSGRRKDGSEFPIEIGLNPLNRDGKHAILATVVDITTRRQVAESQKLLIGELRHRTQNLFAVVQAIANQSLTKDRTSAEAKYVFSNRLLALSRAYETVADGGEKVAASLSFILDRQLAGFSPRVTISGCEIHLGASAAQNFALIVHELTTNALKYGALSEATGHVSIEGRTVESDGDRLFHFRWKEAGGPAVSSPTRRGFGSMILIDMASQFGRNVSLTYPPDGLLYEFEIVLGAILPSRTTTPPPQDETRVIRST